MKDEYRKIIPRPGVFALFKVLKLELALLIDGIWFGAVAMSLLIDGLGPIEHPASFIMVGMAGLISGSICLTVACTKRGRDRFIKPDCSQREAVTVLVSMSILSFLIAIAVFVIFLADLFEIDTTRISVNWIGYVLLVLMVGALITVRIVSRRSGKA